MDAYFRFLYVLIIIGSGSMLTGCYNGYQTSLPYRYDGRMAGNYESPEPCSYTSQDFIETDHDHREFLPTYNEQFNFPQDNYPNPSKKVIRPPSGRRSTKDVEVSFTESRRPKKQSDD